jgi:hypothetical protein
VDVQSVEPLAEGPAVRDTWPVATQRTEAAAVASVSLVRPVGTIEDVLRELQLIRELLKD